jgi:REP element-mobilizing transposase RayT
MLLPKAIGYFKMNSAKEINQLLNTPGTPVWQKNYYEHITRNEQEYERISRYIESNPLNWIKDEEYNDN